MKVKILFNFDSNQIILVNFASQSRKETDLLGDC